VNGCILCGGLRWRSVLCEGPWAYLRCRRCGLVFLHPQPTSEFLHQHYQDYLPDDQEGVESWRRLMIEVWNRSGRLIQQLFPIPGRLLDVGCGYGFFLERMALCGWQVKGIEISAKARRYAREVLRLEVSEKALPRPDWRDGSFDVVTLFYVIEHLADPLSTLRETHRLLRPGGLLLLRWPHTTPLARMLKPWADHLKLYQAPSHLFDFSPATLGMMLRRSGFQAIRTTVSGWTRPKARGALLAGTFFGAVGEQLARLSGDRLLLPGVSKTTLAWA